MTATFASNADIMSAILNNRLPAEFATVNDNYIADIKQYNIYINSNDEILLVYRKEYKDLLDDMITELLAKYRDYVSGVKIELPTLEHLGDVASASTFGTFAGGQYNQDDISTDDENSYDDIFDDEEEIEEVLSVFD